MAISYSLDMATPATAEYVARALLDVAGASGLLDAQVTPESLVAVGAVTAGGTWVRVLAARPRTWSPVLADLGFRHTVSAVFRLADDSDISAQQDDMIRLVSGLLDSLSGDAVLHFQYETIWLLRRAGDLSLNERDDLWPVQRLGLVTLPYRRATYHFDEADSGAS
jgi:hypothetical protein